ARPSSRAVRAAPSPAAPAPTTTTSQTVLLIDPLPLRRPGGDVRGGTRPSLPGGDPLGRAGHGQCRAISTYRLAAPGAGCQLQAHRRQRRRQESGMAEPDTATVVTIATTGQSFRCPKDELILDAGLEAGIVLPHNCRGGACGTCKSQILEGEVDHGWVMSFAISDEEKVAGKCLICQSRPLTPRLVIRPDNAMAPAEDAPPVPVEATGRVIAAEPVTPSIRRLVIALPPELRFRFRAGMHVELRTPGVARPRTYSIACAPGRDG